MLRKIVILAVCVLLPVGLAMAQSKEANGTVKSVSGDSIVVTDSSQKDWTFTVDNTTTILAKGATHKTADAKEAGKATKVGDFVKAKDTVVVKYTEKEGKMIASEVRVK